MGKRLFYLFVFSNLFIAGCAVAMVIQTNHFLLRSAVNIHFICFVFFSTVCSYSFHWYLTKDPLVITPRVKWMERNRKVHLVLFIAGLIGAGIFFFYLYPWWPWLFLSAGMTFLYSAPKIPHPWFRMLRKVALGKTIFLAGVWTHVTTVLPVIISGQDWKMEHTLFVISRFFLVYAICILFDYRDRDDDRKNGVRSLITYLGEKGITALFIFSLTVFFGTTLLLLRYDYAPVAIMLLLLPGIITGAIYNYARRNFSDSLYYFVLDGLMALSAILMLVAGI
ncbi:MAG: UbiA family prenyltransferase [Chitinophagaceae bacterium]